MNSDNSAPSTPTSSPSIASSQSPPSTRKRSLTVHEFQPNMVEKKARLSQWRAPQSTPLAIDDLVTKFRTMSPMSPHLESMDELAPSTDLPFVFDKGSLSLCSPSLTSGISSISPITSEASTFSDPSPFLPTSPASPWQSAASDVLSLSFWGSMGHHNSMRSAWAQDHRSPLPLRHVSGFDSSHPTQSVADLHCPMFYVDVALPTVISAQNYLNSSFTVALPRNVSVCCLANVYNRGILLGSHETYLEEGFLHEFGLASYTGAFPAEYMEGLLVLSREGEGGCNEDSLTIVLEFVVLPTTSESSSKVILAMVCTFRIVPDQEASEISVCRLISSKPPLQVPPQRKRRASLTEFDFFAKSPSVDLHDDTMAAPSFTSRRARLNPQLPKLSLSIPPPSGPLASKGPIELCSATPSSNTSQRPWQTLPQSAYPHTPFDQLIHTPLHPPEAPRAPGPLESTVRTRKLFAPTPTEECYPFTLSSAQGTSESILTFDDEPMTASTPSVYSQPDPEAPLSSNGARTTLTWITRRAFTLDQATHGAPSVPPHIFMRRNSAASPPLASPYASAASAQHYNFPPSAAVNSRLL